MSFEEFIKKLPYEEYEALALKAKRELLSDITAYLHLGHTHAELDDGYTPTELRRIADAIEEFDKRLKAMYDANQT